MIKIDIRERLRRSHFVRRVQEILTGSIWCDIHGIAYVSDSGECPICGLPFPPLEYQVKALNIQPGQILVVVVAGDPFGSYFKAMHKKRLKSILPPGCRVMIFFKPVDVEVHAVDDLSPDQLMTMIDATKLNIDELRTWGEEYPETIVSRNQVSDDQRR